MTKQQQREAEELAQGQRFKPDPETYRWKGPNDDWKK